MAACADWIAGIGDAPFAAALVCVCDQDARRVLHGRSRHALAQLSESMALLVLAGTFEASGSSPPTPNRMVADAMGILNDVARRVIDYFVGLAAFIFARD